MPRLAWFPAIVLALALIASSPAVVSADHTWSGYHWARTTSSFLLRLGDNVSPAWDAYLSRTSSAWTATSALDTRVVAGRADARTCDATPGRVEVCSAAYGDTGWLGIASVAVRDGHITQATVRLNDTYFSKAPYDTAAWRDLVMCQEVGHALGLSHQDEDYANANLGSCMDYTRSPGTNRRPNQHDHQQLSSTYRHLDSTSTLGGGAAGTTTKVRTAVTGGTSTFVRELGEGDVVVSHVMWADGRGHHEAMPHAHHADGAQHARNLPRSRAALSVDPAPPARSLRDERLVGRTGTRPL